MSDQTSSTRGSDGAAVIVAVHAVDDELVEAFDRLIPQLSSSSPPPSRDHLVALVGSEDTVLFVARVDGRILGSLALAFAGVTGAKPYALIGRGLAGKGAGVEYIPIGGVQWQDTYITVVNDTPKGMNQAIGDVVAGQANAINSLTTLAGG